jgi:BlaI family transcriptional regulator, penicillinase repressor
MTAQPRQVSDTELEILKVLWDLEEGTVRDVLDHLNRDGREWAYTTAQTLLSRLQEKGFVESTKAGRAFVFRPTVSRDDLLGQSLEALAERVCDGAAMPLLLNLVESGKFKPREIAKFRKLLDRLEEGGK